VGDDTELTSASLSGGKLTELDVARYEASLTRTPDKVEVRAALVGFYSLHRGTAEANELMFRHVTWFIENRPELRLGPLGMILEPTGPEAFADAKAAWLRVLEARADEPAVLRSASDFFRACDPNYAMQLLRRGLTLEPDGSDWHVELARLASQEARLAYKRDSPAEGEALAREAGAEFDLAIAKERSPARRCSLMIDAAQAAVVGLDFERAKELAETVLARAEDFQRTWIYGNAIHWCHVVLGHVALAHNDVEAACAHLEAASATPGGPGLNSSGPDQELAVKLLARGRRNKVVAYAEACKRFYGGGLGLLGAAYVTSGAPVLRIVK